MKTALHGISLFIFMLACLSATPSNAADAKARAAELATWRDQCNDPDPDLQLAYIESAIATKDISIQRICLGKALESDNENVRNIGLRAAIASMQHLTFTVELPNELAAEYKNSANDPEKLEKFFNSDPGEVFSPLRNGLLIDIVDASMTTGKSTWHPLAGLNKSSSNYQGVAIVEGSKISWVGSICISNGNHSSIIVHLEPGGILKGFLQCEGLQPFPITAKLL